MSIDADSISENGGFTTAIVRRSDTSGNLTVTLSSSDPSEATVVSTVVIPDGSRASAPFTIHAVDDSQLDGSQNVVISALATGHESGSDSLEIADDESATTVNSIGSDLVVAVATAGFADSLELRVDGANLIIRDLNRPIQSAIPGVVGNGTNELAIPLSTLTGKILVETTGQSSLLVLDGSLGTLAAKIQFSVSAGANQNDRVRINGGGLVLDLTQFHGVDEIDLRGSGNNVLNISLAASLANSDSTNDVLKIRSDSDDRIQWDSGWSLVSTLVDGGVFYRVLTQQGRDDSSLGSTRLAESH